MEQRNPERPERDGVDLSVTNVVRSIPAYDAGDESPGAEETGGKRCNVGLAGGAGVDAASEEQG